VRVGMCPYIFNDGTVPRVDASKHAFAGAHEKYPFFPLPASRYHSRRIFRIAIVVSTFESVLIFLFSAYVALPKDSCVHADGHTPGQPLGRAQKRRYPELLPVGLSTAQRTQLRNQSASDCVTVIPAQRPRAPAHHATWITTHKACRCQHARRTDATAPSARHQ